MNDLLRLLRRSLRPFGYDIRKFGTYNLLPFRNLGDSSVLERVRKNFDDHGKGVETCDLDTLKIIFRTCLTEKRSAKLAEGVASSLADLVERCLSSIVASINHAAEQTDRPKIELILLDDHSDAACLDRLRSIAARANCPMQIQPLEGTGQGASLHRQFMLARTDDALYYFCEDDYLHEKTAIYEMWAFYRQIFTATQRHLVIHPQEHECLYSGPHYPSYLMLSPHRHWRTVSDATHILFTHSHVVRDYWRYFENTRFVGDRRNRKRGSERRTTNRIYSYLPCFAPIPALAGHMQTPHVMPPFFDWHGLWDRNKPAESA